MSKYKFILLTFIILFPSLINSQEAVFYNKGKMTVKGSTSESGTAALYIQGGMAAGFESEIYHEGKTVLTGNFINNVIKGNVFKTRNGIFEFRGKTAQTIKGSADKSSHYIQFPNTIIINMDNPVDELQSVVVIDTCMGVSVKDIIFKKGRLVVDSKAEPDPSSTNPSRKTGIAHLWVEENATIDYKHGQSDKTDEGMIQVNLDFGKNHTVGGLMGFASPYKKMYADYFFFNFLSMPSSNKLFDGPRDGIWIRNPLTPLPAGIGYVLGMGLVRHDDPTYYNNSLDAQWSGALYNKVVKDKFTFARMLADASFTRFNTFTDKYEGEEINISDVEVSITQGFNYLGNPFTVPLDLSTFITDRTSGDWGTFSAGEIDDAVYILSRGRGELSDGKFEFTTTFETVSSVGGTSDNGPLIAPMQIFVVKKETPAANTFKIPMKKRSHGNKAILKSDNSVTDELLIETQDMITGGYDRLCVVFRNDGTLKSDHRYDTEKLFNKTGGVNQIYTVSSDNKRLTTNVIPNTTKELKMYFEPSSYRQEVTLKAGRLESLYSVRSVILEDLLTGKSTNLVQKKSYTFLSSPTDKADRFILRFSSIPTGIDEVSQQPLLNVNYDSGVISVQGLKNSHIGDVISIYDIKGQLVYQQNIDESYLTIYKSLNKGVYIVRVNGDNSVAKFMVK